MNLSKKIIALFIIISIILSNGIISFAAEDENKIWTNEGGITVDIPLNKGSQDIETKGAGVVDVDFHLSRVTGSDTYLLFYNVKSTNLINGFVGQVKVKSTSFLFPETYLSKYVNHGFPATY